MVASSWCDTLVRCGVRWYVSMAAMSHCIYASLAPLLQQRKQISNLPLILQSSTHPLHFFQDLASRRRHCSKDCVE